VQKELTPRRARLLWLPVPLWRELEKSRRVSGNSMTKEVEAAVVHRLGERLAREKKNGKSSHA